MIVLALVLIVGAALFAVGILLNATGDTTMEAFGIEVSTNEAGLFIAGAATMLVFLLGLWLLARGSKRARRRRAEVKDLKHNRSSEVEQLRQEKARLEEQVHHDRGVPPASTSGSGGSYDDGSVPRDRAVPGGTSGQVDRTDNERQRH